MTAWSRISLRHRAFALGAVLSLGWVSCAVEDRADLEAAERDRPGTKAGCEEAGDDLRRVGEFMLPGRDCGTCHRAGGQAADSPWTVSGTVYKTERAPCNTSPAWPQARAQGPTPTRGVFVEIQDIDGKVQPNGYIPVNAVGNFYSSFRYTTPLRVRVILLDEMNPTPARPAAEQLMKNPLGSAMMAGEKTYRVNCNECHQNPPISVDGLPPPPGRVFLK
jgi:mono/diheme cytochrome c family protein